MDGASPGTSREVHDVVIVGAGPHGLAVLSSLHSSSAWMTDMQRERSFQGAKDKTAGRKKQQWSVCVVDDQPWLGAWHKRFEALDIEWLRSPAMAHPSAFNEDALLEFANRTGRTDELRDLDFSAARSHAGGSNTTTFDRKANMSGLWKTYSGLYALPTAGLFRDFCAELAASLPHEFVRSRARKIVHQPQDELVEVLLENGARVRARYLVLALGAAGPSAIPAGLGSAEPQRLLHTSQWHRFHEIEKGDRVLVVGELLSLACGGFCHLSAPAPDRRRWAQCCAGSPVRRQAGRCCDALLAPATRDAGLRPALDLV